MKYYLINEDQLGALKDFCEVLEAQQISVVGEDQDSVPEKPEQIQFFRYYRDDRLDPSFNFGVTVQYHIDFTTRTVTAKLSICNGDRFEKYYGRLLASDSPWEIKFPYTQCEDPMYWSLLSAVEDVVYNSKVSVERTYYKTVLKALQKCAV
jgi:hypothetical protein